MIVDWLFLYIWSGTCADTDLHVLSGPLVRVVATARGDTVFFYLHNWIHARCQSPVLHSWRAKRRPQNVDRSKNKRCARASSVIVIEICSFVLEEERVEAAIFGRKP